MSARFPAGRGAGSSARGGFTLLEVVVATSILLVLTLMIGSLFRQATSAWNTGRVRGEGSMIARGVLGSVARDLATAVDGRPYGFSGGPEASGGTLTFVCLKSAGETGETVHRIEYSVSSRRAERKDSVWNGKTFKHVRTSTLFEIDGSYSPIESASFELVGPDSRGRTLAGEAGDREAAAAEGWADGATAVKLRMKLSQKGAFSAVAVRSLGKNGKEDDEKATDNDDIVVN